MPPLTPEQLEYFRSLAAGLNIPDDRKDEIIRIVDSIAVSFVDQAFGLDPTTLSLSARANFSFLGVNKSGKEGSVFKGIKSNISPSSAGEDTTPESP